MLTLKIQCMMLQVLRKYVNKCLQNASSAGHSSIAIPSIGTGNLRYPKDVVARAMFDEVHEFSLKNPQTNLRLIHLVVYEKDKETVKV